MEKPPLLIYDGDCGFCGYWARYWQRLTGDAVRYAPYQEVAQDYPQIAPDEFRRAVQFVTPEGHIARAAEASFLTLSHAPARGIWLTLYRRLPVFAPVSEAAYAFIAAHRSAAYTVSRWLWGREHIPPGYTLTIALFLRGLALIYGVAFLSLATQVTGLIGSHGILPAGDYFAAAKAQVGAWAWWLLPSVFWLNASNAALLGVCWAGVALSLLLFLNVLPRVALALLFALYLSLFHAGQDFLSFQWDMLLLETGCVALALSTGSHLAVWLARWLVFRFMFMSGLVKVLSGDASWAQLTALSYHFETQPLPTPLAWYAHHFPPAVLAFATAATLFIEVVLPFFIFLPRRVRFVAAWGIVLLQLTILVTGNYNFFNLLALLLCLMLLDDEALARVLPRPLCTLLENRAAPAPAGKWGRASVAIYAAFNIGVGALLLAAMTGDARPRLWANEIEKVVSGWPIANRYGPFSIMTTARPEIAIEGSTDGEHWREYAFKYKPVDTHRAPLWNIPHQPRLDWQMWFAALGTRENNPWFEALLLRLLQNSPDVLALLATNPFPDAPPKYVRAVIYDYRYADAADQARGIWWQRKPIGVYYPPVGLAQ